MSLGRGMVPWPPSGSATEPDCVRSTVNMATSDRQLYGPPSLIQVFVFFAADKSTDDATIAGILQIICQSLLSIYLFPFSPKTSKALRPLKPLITGPYANFCFTLFFLKCSLLLLLLLLLLFSFHFAQHHTYHCCSE